MGHLRTSVFILRAWGRLLHRGGLRMFSAASSSPIWKIDQQDAGQKQEDQAGEMVCREGPGEVGGGLRGGCRLRGVLAGLAGG